MNFIGISPINGYPEYQVTTEGEVIGKRGKPMVGHVDRCGYREVILSYYPKIQKQALVHRLVISTFCPIENMEDYQVNHKNGDKLDNRLENLEWCTRSENIKHAYQNGLEKKRCGEEHHSHVLTEDQVRYIKRVYVKRDRIFGASALSLRFGVDRTTIHDIIRGKTWRHLND